MKKKIILSAVAAFVMCTTTFADNVQTLTINGKTVDKVVTQITFSGDNAVLHFGNETESFLMNDVVLSFAQNADGIRSNVLNSFTLSGLVDGNMRIGGLGEGTAIRIYDAMGKLQASATAHGETTQINLENLNSGVYILKAGDKIVKFVKR